MTPLHFETNMFNEAQSLPAMSKSFVNKCWFQRRFVVYHLESSSVNLVAEELLCKSC